MNMETITSSIEKIVEMELERAGDIHGVRFHSRAEGLKVLEEELREVSDEFECLVEEIIGDWDRKKRGKHFCAEDAVFSDNYKQFAWNMENAYDTSIRLLTEMVQVAAMCRKNITSFEEE